MTSDKIPPDRHIYASSGGTSLDPCKGCGRYPHHHFHWGSTAALCMCEDCQPLRLEISRSKVSTFFRRRILGKS